MQKRTLLRPPNRKASVLQRQSPPATRAMPSHPLLHLQRTVGNQLVGRLVQTQLKVSQPGDKDEQEADQVAATVMRMPASSTVAGRTVSSHTPFLRLQRVCAECEEKLQRQPEEEEEQAIFQPKEISAHSSEVSSNRQISLNPPKAGGQPLPESVRAFFEPRFGYDFSQVRLHTDAQAADSARAMKARAFTVGRDVVFGAGEYALETGKGLQLLAHELTYVVQQSQSSQLAAAGNNPAIAKIQQVPVGPRLQRAGFVETISRFLGGGTFSDKELQDYLAFLNKNKRIENSYDSDNKAREIVKRWKQGDAAFSILPVIPTRILLIKEMLSGFTGNDDERAILELLRDSPPRELETILASVGVQTLRDNFHGEERKQLEALLFEHEDVIPGPGGAWTAAGVIEILRRHGDQHVIESLIKEGYKVLRFTAAFDKWRYDDGRVKEEEIKGLRGNTCRVVQPPGCPRPKEIRLRKSLSNEAAATTLFHEVGHVTGGASRTREEALEQEINVRIATEEFRLRHGMPESQPGYRKPDGTVNKEFIRNQIMASPHYNPTGRTRIGRRYEGEEEVTGWHLPGKK